MIARVLSMPDDEADFARWFDEQIVGDNIHELVAELAAVHDADPRLDPGAVAMAKAVVGDSLPQFLAGGTAALSSAQRRGLLTTPAILPAVQELVFIEGGPYWHDLIRQADPTPSFSAADVLARLETATNPSPRSAILTPEGGIEDGNSPQRRQKNKIAAGLAALAACLLVGVTWSLLQPPVTAPWGWNRPGALAVKPPAEYLDSLATAAEEWSDEQPNTEAALAKRLGDLMTGCDRLIASPHESLEPADREWLVERCRAWREKIAGHLAVLEASHDLTAVRRDADATVAKLVAALQTRARAITSRSGDS